MADIPKPASQILREARALIDEPGKWTQGALARFVDGGAVDDRRDLIWRARREGIICLCAEGAVCLAAGGNEGREDVALEFLRDAIGGVFVYAWNDAPERTHAEAMNVFARAIALAEAEAEEKGNG